MAFRGGGTNKYTSTKYNVGSRQHNQLYHIATQMVDHARSPSDPTYMGVTPSSSLYQKMSRCLLGRNSRYVFTRTSWDLFLWENGYVDSRNELPTLQNNLIRNGMVEKISGGVIEDGKEDFEPTLPDIILFLLTYNFATYI